MKQHTPFITLLAISIVFSSCQNTNKEKAVKKSKIKQVVIVPEPANESKLNGQFTFDLTMQDKRNPSKKGRDYLTKKAIVESLDMDMTFYGNGKGVGFLDNGENKYMTKKMIESQRFEYKIHNDTLFFKTTNDIHFQPFAVILDETANKDYFEVHIIDTRFPIGLYKIGESSKQTN